MSATGLNRSPAVVTGGLVLAGAGVAAVTLVAASRYGPPALALPPLMAVGALLLRRPELALGMLIGLVVLAESDQESFTRTAFLYTPRLPGLSLVDIAYLAVTAIVLVDCVRRRELPRVPALVAAPLLLLVFAACAGAVAGWFAGTGLQPIAATLLVLFYLVITPVLVVATVRTERQVRAVLGVATALIAAKALAGVIGIYAGYAPIQLDGGRITYYEPTSNWLICVLLVTISAAVLRRVKLPPRVLWLWPLLLLALVLSYRRSFWVLAVIALFFVLLLGASRLQRMLAVPAMLVVVGGVYLSLSAGLGAGLQGPVVERAKALSPSEIEASADDQYRITERRNVTAELARHPVVGLGIGVPWVAREPLNKQSAGALQYSHIALLWYWMKLGILGPLAYLGIMLSTALAGYRVFRRHPDRILAIVGLGACCSLLGLLVAELTASWSGVETQFTITLGALVGLVAVMYRQAREAAAGQGPRVRGAAEASASPAAGRTTTA